MNVILFYFYFAEIPILKHEIHQCTFNLIHEPRISILLTSFIHVFDILYRSVQPFQLHWLRNGITIKEDNHGVRSSHLQLHPVERSDQGHYRCQVISGDSILLDIGVGELIFYGMFLTIFDVLSSKCFLSTL